MQIEFVIVQFFEEVFQVNYFDDVVQGVFLSYRVNLVQVLVYDVIQLFVVYVYVNGYDVVVIGYDGVDIVVVQGEDVVYNILFYFLYFIVFGFFVYYGFDFFFSYFFFCCVDMQQVEDK